MIDQITNANYRQLIAQEAQPSRKPQDAPGAKKDAAEDTVDLSQALSGTLQRQDVSLDVTFGADAEGMRYSASLVMEKVSIALKERFGLAEEQLPEAPEGLPEEATAGELLEYVNPQNTASRILGFTTGFLSAYTQNHGDESGAEQVDGFVNLIGEAIREGFAQAEEDLGGSFEALGEAGETIKETFNLVMAGLDNYRENQMKLLGSPTGEVAQAALPDTLDLQPPPVDQANGGETSGLDILG